eukprot:snap_masked-scaffold_38-processed-gene-2.85-mRNA-1 protein AED:1.00 eAED:1.00 QI:0/-1/0/0/-1/1/1/0/68
MGLNASLENSVDIHHVLNYDPAENRKKTKPLEDNFVRITSLCALSISLLGKGFTSNCCNLFIALQVKF